MAGEALTVPQIPLARIRVHPANPRIDATADAAMVDSIRSQGILEPLMVAPAEDGVGWILIDGHRRYDGAAQAGLDTVPVNPRYDLATEAQQVEVMAVTGLQKELLTPVEEAQAYEQLSLLGMDAKAIASATGFSRSRVKSRMKLTGLSEVARGQLHGGQLTLGDAETLLEFADDADATAELEKHIGTGMFRYQVQDARQRRARTRKQQDLVAEYETAGAVHTTNPHGWRMLRTLDEPLGNPDVHDSGDGGCLGWFMHGSFGGYNDPALVCIDPARHGIPDPATASADAQSERESEWERQREERRAREAADEAAAAARLEWLVDHFTGMFPVKGHAGLATAAKALLPLGFTAEDGSVDVDLSAAALGLDTADHDGSTWHAVNAYADGLHAAGPSKVLVGFAAYLACDFAAQLRASRWAVHQNLDEIRRYAQLWTWLAAAGYPMSDVDLAQQQKLTDRIDVLTTEEADGDQ